MEHLQLCCMCNLLLQEHLLLYDISSDMLPYVVVIISHTSYAIYIICNIHHMQYTSYAIYYLFIIMLHMTCCIQHLIIYGMLLYCMSCIYRIKVDYCISMRGVYST
jgi:hypothetical protein